MEKILLRGRGIEHAYLEGKIKTPVLKGVDLDIEASRMTAIVGKSGSGKSTLLHILGTLDTPNKGEIFFQDVNVTKLSSREKARFRNRHLGFVYQFHHLLGDFTALENVMLPLLIDRVDRSLAIERSQYLLERVGLADMIDHLPSELSGGERQRVAIARALVHSPELILADEPTGNLDESNANVVFELFRELVRDEGAAVVMVTHDNSLAQQCDSIFEIVNGTIIGGHYHQTTTVELPHDPDKVPQAVKNELESLNELSAVASAHAKAQAQSQAQADALNAATAATAATTKKNPELQQGEAIIFGEDKPITSSIVQGALRGQDSSSTSNNSAAK